MSVVLYSDYLTLPVLGCIMYGPLQSSLLVYNEGNITTLQTQMPLALKQINVLFLKLKSKK